MAKKQKQASPVPVESIKHKDAQTNIPTQEIAVKVINHYGGRGAEGFDV